MLVCSADGRLRQDPAEELAQLREGSPSSQEEILCSCERGVPLQGSAEQALDVTLTLWRGDATASGLLLRAWLREAQEGVPCAEVLILDWEKSELQVLSSCEGVVWRQILHSYLGCVPFKPRTIT